MPAQRVRRGVSEFTGRDDREAGVNVRCQELSIATVAIGRVW
jgi:hypothetical protein